MTIHIAPAVAEDVGGIARVHVQGWRESYKEFLNPASLAGLSVEERAAMWRRRFETPTPAACLLVARAGDGDIVGFASAGPVRAPADGSLEADAEIHAIYLLDRAKRQGVGRRLMLGLFDHLAGQSFRSAGLWVLKGNVAARRFYEALGGVAGAEQALELRGQSVTEIAYRFAPLPTRS